MTNGSDWIDWTPGRRMVNDLTPVMVRNVYGEEFGPVLIGMIDPEALDNNAFHASCDIVAVRAVVPEPKAATTDR